MLQRSEHFGFVQSWWFLRAPSPGAGANRLPVEGVSRAQSESEGFRNLEKATTPQEIVFRTTITASEARETIWRGYYRGRILRIAILYALALIIATVSLKRGIGDMSLAWLGIALGLSVLTAVGALYAVAVFAQGYTVARCNRRHGGAAGSDNVFVSGGSGSGSGLMELPRGSSTFTTISINHALNAGGAVQWDGQYLALESPQGNGRRTHGPTIIYRISVLGSTGTVVKTIDLSTGKSDKNPGYAVEFWIQNKRIVSPKTVGQNVGLWQYPAGGTILKTVVLAARALGLTVSLAPSQ